MPYFKYQSPGYRQNIQRIVREVVRQVNSPQDLQYISVITGSMQTADQDLDLMRGVIEAFDRAGFGHCEYGFYSSNIHTPKHLQALRQMRVVFLTITLQTTSAEARQRLHGRKNPKRLLGFDDTLRLIRQADDVFPYINVTLMLGYEPAEVLKHNLEILEHESNATVNHYIPRIWSIRQFELLDPSARNLEYYVDLCAFIERQVNAGKRTIGQFFEERFGIPKYKIRYRS